MDSLDEPDLLSAAKTLGKDVNQGSINVVDCFARFDPT